MDIKGVEVEVGDFVAFRTPVIPLPEIQAGVYEVKDGMFWSISPLFIPWRHNGKFTPDEVDEIMVVYPAEVAVKQESHGRFNLGDRVVATQPLHEGDHIEGRVVGAFGGVVVVKNDEGYAPGGSNYWELVD